MRLPVNYNTLSPQEKRAVREEYIKRQEGNCYFCHSPIEGPPSTSITKKPVHEEYYPPGFFDHPVHLHHNHQTGMTIGTVHAYCNAVLWEYHGE